MKQIILCIFLSLLSSITFSRDYYVSPSGDDHNPGTIDLPFATMVAARNAIRALPDSERSNDINVYLRDGSYHLNETLVFSLEDGAQGKSKITYQAYANEIPVLSSGIRVSAWEKQAKGNIWVARIPDGIDKFFTLYDGEQRLERARSKGFRPLAHEGETGISEYSKLRFPEGTIKDWPNLEDVELLIIPIPWTMNILPLASVDMKDMVATTSIPGSYPLTPTRKWEESVWVENVIDFLDEPGEWVVNTREGKIYYWPEKGEPGEHIMIPSLQELIRVEGKIDYDGPQDIPVENLVFRGLTFMHGKRDLWDKDHLGWGVQHDWEKFDRSTALLRFRGAEKCEVDACHFTSSGGTAIRLDLHCQQIQISNNLIEHMGNQGILLCGYGPGIKDVNKRNSILNNHIRYVGELYWHGHGIMIWQSGENLLSNNLIHDGPRKALSISGVRHPSFNINEIGKAECSLTIRRNEIPDTLLNSSDWQAVIPFMHARDNVFEYNEVHHVLQMLGDGAAINVSGAGEGNIIRRNYIHHMSNHEANGGFRTDGWQKGTHFVENVLYKSGGITRKNYNHVASNLMIDLDSPHSILFAAFPGEANSEEPEEGSRVLRNVMFASEGTDRPFFKVPKRHYKSSSSIEHCQSDYNIFFNSNDPGGVDHYLQGLRANGSDFHSLNVDPMFMDIEKEDFRFKPDSPALKMGIPQLDVKEMGLLDSFPAKYR